MPHNYEKYVQEVSDDIESCIDNMGCQPILFIGSGLSMRYFNAPTWEGLLEIMAQKCPLIDKSFAYYKQREDDLINIGSTFSSFYQEWAWGIGREEFPDQLFEPHSPSEAYFKNKVCEYLDGICPSSLEDIVEENMKSEIELLQSIKPHSIITTNYDKFAELVFPDYQPIIGQQVLRSSFASIGEIFKIHGCTSEPNQIVITRKDYDHFQCNKKYLSAKLLTYFIEHPLVFIGYRASDPNIVSILSDIDKILSEDNEIIPNIYILEWKSSISTSEFPSKEKPISLGEGRHLRVKSITADNFNWVFSAFGKNSVLDSPNPKVLRSILARTYDLVRHDIPRKTLEVDYRVLEHAIDSNESLAKLLGITTLSNATSVNANHPYIISQVASIIGYGNRRGAWNYADALIKLIERDTGINIKTSDNPYHLAVSAGKSKIHKYSDEAVQLLLAVKNGLPYELRF